MRLSLCKTNIPVFTIAFVFLSSLCSYQSLSVLQIRKESCIFLSRKRRNFFRVFIQPPFPGYWNQQGCSQKGEIKKSVFFRPDCQTAWFFCESHIGKDQNKKRNRRNPRGSCCSDLDNPRKFWRKIKWIFKRILCELSPHLTSRSRFCYTVFGKSVDFLWKYCF